MNMRSATSNQQPSSPPIAATAPDVHTTTCCIVGAGPAGAVLALLLARKGISVTLLESHMDFERDFRGDTIHPSVMELMAELGLAERLLQLRHTRLSSVTLPTTRGPVTLAPFTRLKTRFPYITMMPQAAFLEFITTEAQRYPNFKLVLGARVEQIIEEGHVVRGVRYHAPDGRHDVRALLTVGADGRFSKLRRLGQFTSAKTSPPMDVLWFRIPRQPSDSEEIMGRFGNGHMLLMLNRYETWQIAYLILKGSYQQLHVAGLPALRQSIAEVIPEFADRLESLQDWKQIALLSVESDRVKRWYKPGLLLIGDAAHVMSPVGGVGINFAIQDAVVAANVLAEPLAAGRIELRQLRAVQRRREWPTRIMQMLQTFGQKQVVARALDPTSNFQPPSLLRTLSRVPFLRDIPGRVLAYGLWPVHAKS